MCPRLRSSRAETRYACRAKNGVRKKSRFQDNFADAATAKLTLPRENTFRTLPYSSFPL